MRSSLAIETFEGREEYCLTLRHRGIAITPIVGGKWQGDV